MIFVNPVGRVGVPVIEPDCTPVKMALDKLYPVRFALAKFAFVRSAVGPTTVPATSPHPVENVGLEVATTELDATWFNVAPVKFAEVTVAPRSDALVKFALVKFADVRFAFFRTASVKLAFEKLAPVITVLVKIAPERLAPVNVALVSVVVLSERLERFTFESDAPVRSAPGPMRYPLVSDQPVGRVGPVLAVAPPEMIPLRVVPVKLAFVRLLLVRITPLSVAPEKFTLVRFEP